MPTDKINGINLYWESKGRSPESILFVHGSWGDHHNWDPVVNELSKNFTVVTYDRRGHSMSQRLETQGSLDEDADDLTALVDFLKLKPAHIIGNSGGASVALKTAAKNPDIFRSLIVHEPPLFGLLKGIAEAQPYLQVVNSRIAAVVELAVRGENEAAAKLFVETIAFGPGAWVGLPDPVKQTFVYNAPTFLDETRDAGSLEIDTTGLSRFNKPALLSNGTQSPPFFLMVLNQLAPVMAGASRYVFEGAGHVPHMSHPQQYVEMVKSFCSKC